jgi:hypothetical protein
MTITLTQPQPTEPGHYFCKRPRDYRPKFVEVVETLPGRLLLINPEFTKPFSRLTGKEKWSEKIEFEKES